MANAPSPPWTLSCPWCEWQAIVNARGAHRNDPGSGVEAALAAQRHAERIHDRSWREFLEASNQESSQS